MIWFVLALGGAFGASARYGVSQLASAVFGDNLHWATLAINVFGSCFLGIAYNRLSAGSPLIVGLQAFFIIGFLGSFTTFSSFAFEIFYLFRNHSIFTACAYLLGSVILSVMALIVGLVIGQRI